jgi:Cu/Ag efflux pump CusA
MTSLAAALGMLPLADGIGSGADMLKPLDIAVMGALGISVLLSLVARPTVLRVSRRRALIWTRLSAGLDPKSAGSARAEWNCTS